MISPEELETSNNNFAKQFESQIALIQEYRKTKTAERVDYLIKELARDDFKFFVYYFCIHH